MGRRTKIVVLTAIIIPAALFAAGYAWWRYQYRYGFSHCCDQCLSIALEEYARTHGGAFPAGEATPEGSLSLLYREKTGECRWADANILRGKTVPESVVKEILERGDLLTPETCGWHYVEGLRMDDDPRLALFWDKAGLDHNGGRMAQGGHIVLFVDGQRKYIPQAEWDEFMDAQRKLLAERGTAIRHDATIRINDREVKVQVRVVDDSIYGSTWGGNTAFSSEQIATLKKQVLGVQGLPVIPREEISRREGGG